MLLLSGCSGVLMESKDSSGKIERLKLDSGETRRDLEQLRQ
jgi:hypothetical protein